MGTRISIAHLGKYVLERGGLYRLPLGDDSALAPRDALAAIGDWRAKGPATAVQRGDGTEYLYSFMSWEKGRRQLVLIRLPPEPPAVDPYDDPALETFISTPRTKIRRVFTVECGTCGKSAYVSAKNYASAPKAFRAVGWHETLHRGWVCPRHYYGPARERRRPEASDAT